MVKTTAVMELEWGELLNSKAAKAKERADFLDATLPRQARELLLESRCVFRSSVQGTSLRSGQQAAPRAW
jgi:hypothetical protein